jgi:hypothetical protein
VTMAMPGAFPTDLMTTAVGLPALEIVYRPAGRARRPATVTSGDPVVVNEVISGWLAGRNVTTTVGHYW